MITHAVRAARVAVALILIAAGCGEGGDSPSSPGGAGAGAGGAGGGGGGAAGFDHVFAPRTFGMSDVIRHIEVDDANIYFRTLDTLYRVPVGGGEPTPYEGRVTAFWLHEGQLLVYENRQFSVMPTAGGARTPAGTIPAPLSLQLLREERSVVKDGKQLWWIRGQAIERYELGGGAPSVIHMAASGSVVTSIAKSGADLFVGIRPDATSPSQLHRLPATGGTPAPVLPDYTGSPFVADDAFVYFIGGPREAIMKSHLHRLPLAGGAPQELVMQHAVTANHAVGPEGYLVSLVGEFYYVPRSSGRAVRLASLPRGTTDHALGLRGRTAYFSIMDTSKRATIIRIQIP